MGRIESRRGERERAFQVLYGLNFVPAQDLAALTRAFRLTPAAKDDEATDKAPEGFAWDLAHGVWSKQADLDRIIGSLSQHWRIQRIAKIELTILRLALFEILHRPDVPVKVAINEAIELAKQFGDENSRGFVNGILDAAAKAVENGEIGVH